jgi:hypothetical protein
MSSLTERYLAHYTPLVHDFVRTVADLEHPDIQKMPEPFLPLFGPTFETSALRLVVVGQDTLGWGDLKDFLAAETAAPGSKLTEGLDYFSDHPFREWGATRQRFWGFTMMLLAALHGQENWELMKQGKMREILDSFAWANGNAIELYGSTAAKMNVPSPYWESVRKAGEPLNRLRHLVEVLKPQVVLVMYRGLNRATYFEGYKPEVVTQDGRLTHYYLPEQKVDVIHVPHPGSMNRIEGADHFCAKLKELFIKRGITKQFPEFLNGQAEGQEVMQHLLQNAPPRSREFDKFTFITWIAEELTKREAFMSVPALAGLLNDRGEETSYGTNYNGGRGTYTLVRSAYHRVKKLGTAEGDAKAHNIAVAFRRPNFEYAYNTD